MKVTLTLDDYLEKSYTRSYNDGFGLDQGQMIEEKEVCLELPGITINNRLINIDGIVITFVDRCNIEKDLIYQVQTDFPYLQMHFELTGSVIYQPELFYGKDCQIGNGQHTLLYYPELNGKLSYLAHSKPGFGVEIELSVDFFKRIFCDDLKVLKQFGRELEKQRPALLGNKSFPMTFKMREILLDMYHCKYAGILKKLFMEAKVTELLTLQLNQILNNPLHEESALRKEDTERLHYIKELIEKKIDQPYSIAELADLACMNRTKLQHGFKSLFNNTIYGYLTDLRMQKARTLILSNGHKLASIANAVGFKNANHFSTAFKKKFGYYPKDLSGS